MRGRRTLTALGDPTGALKVIKAVRAAAPAPEKSPPACVTTYNAAVKKQATGSAIVEWATRLKDKASDAKRSTKVAVPRPIPLVCPDPPAGSQDPPKSEPLVDADTTVSKDEAKVGITEAIEAALKCDSHNKEAFALAKATEPSEDSLAESSKQEWTNFAKAHLEPWVTVLLAFFGWAAVLLALGRLLVVLLKNIVASQMSRHDAARPLVLTAGWLALIVSGGLGVGLLSLLEWRTDAFKRSELLVIAVGSGVAGIVTWVHAAERPAGVTRTAPPDQRWPAARWAVATGGAALILVAVVSVAVVRPLQLVSPLVPSLWAGVAVGAVAVVLFALAWGAGRGLTITAKGAGAPTPEYLRSLTMRLAPDTPRGAEVPSGTDADVLTAVGIVEKSSTPLIAAFARLLALARPATPWQLVVTAHTADVLTAELSRNGRLVESATVDRKALLGPWRWRRLPDRPRKLTRRTQQRRTVRQTKPTNPNSHLSRPRWQ